MKKFSRILVLVFVLTLIVPMTVEAKAPKKPKRIDNYEKLLKFKLKPQIVDLEEADLDKLLNPEFDWSQADEILEEQHGYDEDKIETLRNQQDPYKILTLDQAKEDLDFLLDLMRVASLDYNRVGGDKAFKKFRKKVVKDLEEVSMTRQIYAIDLERAIARWMHFIDNQHFWVGPNYNSPHENKIRYIDKYGYPEDWRWVRYEAHFMCSNLTFQKEGDAYRCYQNERKVDLEDLAAQGIDIVPSWTNDFKIVYRLHYYGRTAKKRPEKIRFKGDHIEVPVWVFTDHTPIDMAAQGLAHDKIHKLMKDVAYVNLTDDFFSNLENYGERIEKLHKMGKKLRKFPCVIFDLRNNTGGYFAVLEALMNRYMGYHSDEYLRPSAHHVNVSSGAYFYKPWKPGLNLKVMSYGNDLVLKHGSDKITEMPGLAIVLVNSNTASCGDLAIDYFRHLSNTLIVGDASNGIMVSSGGYEYFMPNSGLYISVPTDHRIWHPDYFEEGRGFYPDIWMMTDYVDLDALAKYMREITPPRSKK